MKEILSGIFFLITFLGLNQNSEYLYSIKFLKCCDEPTHHDPNWQLESFNGNIYSPENNQISVPNTGKYLLISSIYDNQPIPIQIEKNYETDTIYLKCLEIENSETVLTKKDKQTDPIYITCKGRVNSTYKEFFPDGELRLIGNFREGILIDSLVEFYHSGSIKSKVSKNKTTYEHWYYFPNGKIEKRFKYDLKKRKRYELFEYNEFGDVRTQIEYSKKYSFHYYETGTIKTTTPRRKHEQYFIVNDTVRYQCKKGIESTFYSNGNKEFEFSSKPLVWLDRLRGSKKHVRKEYKLLFFKEDSANVKIQEINFWSRTEMSIYNGGLAKLEVADAFSISFFKNDKSWITIYPIVYEGNENKEVVLYELYDYSQKQFSFQKLKPEEMEKYITERSLKLKCW